MKCNRCERDTDYPQASQRYEGATVCPECAEAERWLTNIEAAIEAWKLVPRIEVELGDWTCGTTHCFGGWLPYFEHFKALGVRACSEGLPYIDMLPHMIYGSEVSKHLFGDPNLFKTRSLLSNGTDWEIVMRRLEKRLSELQANSGTITA